MNSEWGCAEIIHQTTIFHSKSITAYRTLKSYLQCLGGKQKVRVIIIFLGDVRRPCWIIWYYVMLSSLALSPQGCFPSLSHLGLFGEHEVFSSIWIKRGRDCSYWAPVYLERLYWLLKHLQSLNYFLLFLQWKTGHHSIGSFRFSIFWRATFYTVTGSYPKVLSLPTVFQGIAEQCWQWKTQEGHTGKGRNADVEKGSTERDMENQENQTLWTTGIFWLLQKDAYSSLQISVQLVAER